MRKVLVGIAISLLLIVAGGQAETTSPGEAAATQPAETIPPVSKQHVSDQPSILSAGALSELNATLSQFERDTTHQVVVAIYPKMQSSDDLGAYTTRVANAWGVGHRGKDDGVLVLIFSEDRRLFVERKTGRNSIGRIPWPHSHSTIFVAGSLQAEKVTSHIPGNTTGRN